MSIFRRVFIQIFIPLVFVIALACGRSKQPEILPPPIQELQSHPTEPGLHLKAVAQDDILQIDLTNNLERPIPVKSEDFAILKEDRKPIIWDPATMQSRIPRGTLPSSTTLTGMIQFNGQAPLIGHKLVFNPRPHADPVLTIIEKSKPTFAAPPAQKE